MIKDETMNKHFSILLHSVLLVGTLLPLSALSSIEQTLTPPIGSSSDLHLAFGSGIPESRGGGGTR